MIWIHNLSSGLLFPPVTRVFIFKAVFNVADELLKTAAQNPRLALHKAKAGWILLGALMTLGKWHGTNYNRYNCDLCAS